MKPIEVGTYRLRNGRTARLVEITIMNDVRAAAGFVEGLAGDPDESMEWNGDDGLFGRDPGPWDIVERNDTATKPLAQDALSALRKSLNAFETLAKEYSRMASEAERAAQEIEHRIREMERREG